MNFPCQQRWWAGGFLRVELVCVDLRGGGHLFSPLRFEAKFDGWLVWLGMRSAAEEGREADHGSAPPSTCLAWKGIG